MTPEEHAQARAGKVTGSVMATIMTGGYKALNTLAAQLNREAENPPILGVESGIVAMDWGIRNEPIAAGIYWEKHPGTELLGPGWYEWHDDQAAHYRRWVGVSLDDCYYEAGHLIPLEIKCPYNPAVHQAYIKGGTVPTEYIPQAALQMACLDAPYATFASFDPRETSDEYRWFEVKCLRDLEYEARMLQKLDYFLDHYTTGEAFEPKEPDAQAILEMFKPLKRNKQ